MSNDVALERCSECGQGQIVWHADDDLYVEVMGRKDGDTPCPQCFDRRAEVKGIYLKWHPTVVSR